MDALVEGLKGGRNALTAGLLAEFEAQAPACIPHLIEIASSETLLVAPEPEGWAPILAIRILGRLRANDAIPVLLRILEGAEEDDQASAEAARALFRMGADALDPIAGFLGTCDNPHARGLALEVVSNLAMDYRSDGPGFDRVRTAMETLLLDSDDPGLRTMLIEYLGDLAQPESAPSLLAAVRRADLGALEYEALRDALERIGEVCPDLYFDASGKGYPLDDEKEPHCPGCGARMLILDTGDLGHPDPVCASPQVGSESVG